MELLGEYDWIDCNNEADYWTRIPMSRCNQQGLAKIVARNLVSFTEYRPKVVIHN